MKRYLLLFVFLFSAFSAPFYAEEMRDDKSITPAHSLADSKQCNICCGNSLTLSSLCADKARITCIDSVKINTDTVCATEVDTDRLCTDQMSVSNLCVTNGSIKNALVEQVTTNTFCSQVAYAGDLCTDNLTATDVCITGTLLNCGALTAMARAANNTIYTLGTTVPFTIIDRDPSNSFNEVTSRYIAKVSGSYLVTTQIVQNNLTGGGIIIGTPIALLEVYVNGFLRRQDFAPYLSFNNSQTSLLTSLMPLSAGDEMEIRYSVLIVDPSLGVVPYVGTVTLLTAPIIFQGLSTFVYVEYLSSYCDEIQCPNPACIDCSPVTVNCTPCSPANCTPCCMS